MVRIELNERDRELVVHVRGLDKLLLFRSSITVPLSHVTDVVVRPDDIVPRDAAAWFRGTYVPGKMLVGTGRTREGELVFCDVHNPQNTIAIELTHEHYRRMVLEVEGETPEAAAERIRGAIA